MSHGPHAGASYVSGSVVGWPAIPVAQKGRVSWDVGLPVLHPEQSATDPFNHTTFRKGRVFLAPSFRRRRRVSSKGLGDLPKPGSWDSRRACALSLWAAPRVLVVHSRLTSSCPSGCEATYGESENLYNRDHPKTK